MRFFIIFLISLISLVFNQLAHARGQLFLIGGGKRVPELVQTIVKMANQKSGKILIVPLASEIPVEVSESIKAEFLSEKAKFVEVFSCQSFNIDEEKCLKQIQNSDLIFFTGGDQNRLYRAFDKSKSFELIRKRFQDEDLALAGTSAGTAIMSEIMITGNVLAPHTEFDGVRPKMVEVTKGFGFVKAYIIDQHFLKRSRQNRLISTVLEHPHLIGLGIDESTGVLIDNDESFKVFGVSTVTVIDATKAQIQVDENGNFQTNDLKIELKGKMF